MPKPKTLFDFFTKSPANKSPTSNTPKVSASGVSLISTPKSSVRDSKLATPKLKRLSLDEYENSSETEEKQQNKTVVKAKRRRIVIASDSDDSEDEYKPGKESSSEEDESMHSDASSGSRSPKRKRKKTEKKKNVSSLSLSSFKNSKVLNDGTALNSPAISASPNTSVQRKKNSPDSAKKSTDIQTTPVSKKKSLPNGASNGHLEENSPCEENVKEWLHETLDWLKDEKIKDKYGRRKSDPDYDSRTLYVPDNFKKNLTPAMKQWWDIKVNHFDAVLFYKVGKFYELYHMDAVVGVKELGLVYMKGDFAHSGFPEIAYGRYSDCLVRKGYKVGRVEQTETPQMMEERCRGLSRPTKYDKVVAREICQITTKGTRTLTYQDEGIGARSNYLLSICEKHVGDSSSEYGVCFIDTTIGKFHLGQFKDDRHGSRLMTMIALHPPVEILYEKSSVSRKTLELLNNNLNSIPKEALSPGSQFWDSIKVLKFLSESNYFGDKDGAVEWPKTILKMIDPDDRLQQTSLKQHELALKSLGACIWYLKDCHIEDILLTMKLFEEYKPVDGMQKLTAVKRSFLKQHMVLDGVTLKNLEIVPVNSSVGIDGTLFGTMNYCSTNFGKRLFRHWLCSPLCNPESISDRLDAIDDLREIPDVVDTATTQLKKIPDLERLLCKIHTQGLSRSKDQPDIRAIFYEADIYNKRKLVDFLSTLEGFKGSMEIVSQFQPHINDFKSSLLKKCVSYSKENDCFPDMAEALDYFENAFDHKLAQKEGNIVPSPGVDNEYDSACAGLEEAEKGLNCYLEEMKRKLNCKISFVGSGRTRFQLEVPDNKKVPENFEFQGSRKGFKRFYTKEAREFLARITAAEESRDAALQDVTRRMFAHFDKDYNMWKSTVHCLSVLDALISLLLYCKSSEVPMCRPHFSLPADDQEPFLEILDGKHPTFLKYFTGDTYIPNNVYIGPKREEERENINKGGRLILVTGPNMGGKSTLMRQAGTLMIMAHIGSYVPARSMKLTPVDRIFTRVGASDQINKGESTFFVEASETSSILHHATCDSFVLVDELGRGTSTHDGTAIAAAVLDYLANKINCRTLFSTHYHSLVEDFHSHPHVGLGHMACMVEKDSYCPALERITFLYKFTDGACPKSYGFNVALLAGISKQIVHRGFLKAQEMEYQSKITKFLGEILSIMKPEDVIHQVQLKLQNFNIGESKV